MYFYNRGARSLIYLLCISITGVLEVGGVHEVWQLAREGKRTTMGTFDFDPRVRHTYWGSFIGICVLWSVFWTAQWSQVEEKGSNVKRVLFFIYFVSVHRIYVSWGT